MSYEKHFGCLVMNKAEESRTQNLKVSVKAVHCSPMRQLAGFSRDPANLGRAHGFARLLQILLLDRAERIIGMNTKDDFDGKFARLPNGERVSIRDA